MEMTLKEGKNRKIRRMCEAVGLEVVHLKRNAEGVVSLGMLAPGKYRELTKQEVSGEGLRAAAAKGRARPAALPRQQAARCAAPIRRSDCLHVLSVQMVNRTCETRENIV